MMPLLQLLKKTCPNDKKLSAIFKDIDQQIYHQFSRNNHQSKPYKI